MLLGDKPDIVTARGMEGPAPEAPDSGFQGLHPGVVYSASEPASAGGASQANGHLFLIVQRDSDGAPKIHRCEEARQAQIFLETLISDGISQENIELFQASKLPFDVSFRPVVSFVVP